MSTTELKADLHARIESLDEAQLSKVDRFLLQLQLEALTTQLEADFEADHRAGKYSPEKVQAAIDEFRREHPYR